MNCAWKELLALLPSKIRLQMDVKGRENALELRLRLQGKPMLVRRQDNIFMDGTVTQDDLNYVVNMACRYSPWTAATAASGYLTALGGHRIGMCGEALIKDGVMVGMKTLHSLNVRIARDISDVSGALCREPGNILVIGRPGSGKTTLLRDLIRQLSYRETVSVVDERGELFPIGFQRGERMDVLLGCGKSQGIDRVLRTMTPDTIAIDEVTAREDTEGLLQAAWCGVRLLASCHAMDRSDLLRRGVYRPIVESGLFSTLVVMQPDKSFRIERVNL